MKFTSFFVILALILLAGVSAKNFKSETSKITSSKVEQIPQELSFGRYLGGRAGDGCLKNAHC